MKVFISWSGARSKSIAESLDWFLPRVINDVKPWVSSEGISPGSRWSLDISKQLEQCNLGIICLTSENLESPWIHFEAGAISKILDRSSLIPYLFDVKSEDFNNPLTQFQHVKTNKEGTQKIIYRLIEILESTNKDLINKQIYLDSFEKYWEDFEKKLNKIPKEPIPEKEKRDQNDILIEILNRLRNLEYNQQPTFHTYSQKSPQNYPSNTDKLRKMRYLYHRYNNEDKALLSPIEFINNVSTLVDIDKNNINQIPENLFDDLLTNYRKYLSSS